jgi:hypothetical protein
MNSSRKIFLLGISLVLSLAAGATLHADPCLVVYSSGPVWYYYDPAEYYTVTPGDPLYNPVYDRGGKVLLEVGTNAIDLSIYQAPNLIGFKPTYDGNEGYYIDGTDFTLVIDGFSNSPTTYENILVKFDKFTPSCCTPQIYADGNLVTGGTYGAGDLVVSTPTSDGNNYSDTKTVEISWNGCTGLRIWAFADKDHNGVRTGGECFTAYSHDLTIPVQDKTWGSIKALYR